MKKTRRMASVYFINHEKLLLLHREGGSVADGLWIGSAGGHFEDTDCDSPVNCVLREMNEELGLTSSDIMGLTLKYMTTRELDDETRVNYYFFAELKNDNAELKSNEGVLKWFELNEINSLKMPFTAEFMIKHYITEGMHSNRTYSGTANCEEVIFKEAEI